ncbi:MAG: GNAT family protein [Candidatus Krumholzibacteria bacterium]|jgi:RimJ/RimL family protein N-acetyltransferase|nr:GNAT family protein [Candidatus Krumholzibacteria bacterium]MDP6668310.1 GNAT family protein [Candidatus Krumholzibacteria bacterium]MDP6797677.1 GNAT family protein [Candidatus Krumholzibacteria bacterium]MDP7022114.1 GNAT family protein [Candidatus Krumholzibacteria bacterium]
MSPDTHLADPKVLLLPLRMSDARAIRDGVQESLAELMPFAPWAGPDYDLQSARVFLQYALDSNRKGEALHRGIFRPEDRLFLGVIGLHAIRPRFKDAEIGYWMKSSRSGQGLCTRAAGLLIGHAFEELDLERVWLSCDITNIASQRIAEKLGMRREGTLLAYSPDEEGRKDHFLYAILRSEW